MTKLDETEDRITLAELFKSGGRIDPYLLHERFKLSPGQVLSALDKIISLGIARADGPIIELTAYGYQYAIACADQIWVPETRRSWVEQMPDRFLMLPVPKQIYYCPPKYSKTFGKEGELFGET